MPKKIERGDPLVSSGFVGYVKKVKNERGTLCTKFALAGLGLSSFISFCKKWYRRDEVCGLTKKKKKTSHCKSRALFTRKAPTKNKTGTSQVGAISKAQKYSMNNYWKHLEKFFSKKSIFGKKIFKKSIF